MPTENPAPESTGDPAPTGGGDGGQGFKAPTSQAEFDAMVKSRLERERAKFADYDELKAKAQQLDDSQQTTATRIAKLEKELESTRTTALRSRIQAKHGISDEDAELFLTAADEATLTKQAERLAETADDRRKNGNRDPLAGRTPSNPGGGPDAAKREWLRSVTERD
ncbi:hypothetical protein ABRQ22_17280 [Cellulosimicrobium sp. ES-005]|uniref:Scaffolding protein n=1 Tax=Cellulosimicrobium sp. ES-005 TaxID=3163031 RepID=A0AAU8G116_9MICO